MHPALIPLLVVSLLLLSAEGDGIDRVDLMLSGTHEITDQRGALIVGDATVTVPPGTEVPGPIYVIGGEVRIRGTVRSDVTQLAGALIVDAGATIGGRLRVLGGAQEVSDDAAIARRATFELPAEQDPFLRYLPVALLTLVLALIGAWRARKRPDSLERIFTAATAHPVISFTVGTLVTVSFLSLFVFMAFTLILIPVSVVGLLGGLVMLAYGLIALGHLVGRRFPATRTGLASGLGIVAVMVALQLVGIIPILGDLIIGVVLMTGLGAVIITYFGLSEFKPEALPD